MLITNLDIPVDRYFQLLEQGRLPEDVAERVSQAVRDQPDVCVWGASTTARRLKHLLGRRFLTFLDSNTADCDSRLKPRCILVGAAPNHYTEILRTIERCHDSPGLTVLLPFRDQLADPVRVILETQPRSLTGYVANALSRACNLGYATVFENETRQGRWLRRKNVYFAIDGTQRPYIVKSHFFHMVLGSEFHETARTIRLVSFPPDAYYLWGRMIRHGGDSHDAAYRLTASSPEWRELKDHLHLNALWLRALNGQFRMRYEDLVLNSREAAAAIGVHVGADCGGAFTPLEVRPYRSYFSDNYLEIMDREVFSTLCAAFQESIDTLYPEKRDALARALSQPGPRRHTRTPRMPETPWPRAVHGAGPSQQPGGMHS